MAPTVLARFRSWRANWQDHSLWFGWAMAILSTLSFSVSAPIAKGAIVAGLPPVTILAARFIIASLLLGATLGLTAPHRLRMDRQGTLISAAVGLLGGVGMLCFFLALVRLEASIAAMIFSLNPLAVLLLLALRGERFTRRNLVRLVLGIGGVYLLISPGSSGGLAVDWVGILLVMVTIMTAAISMTALQWFLKEYDARAVTLYIVIGMMLVSVSYWFFLGANWQNPGLSGWLSILALAVVGTYMARLTLFAAVRSLGSGQMSLLLPAETLLTVIWSVLFLQERLTLWQWVGGSLILLSAALAINRLRWTGRRLRLRNWLRP